MKATYQSSQLIYCPLAWIFHIRRLKNKINMLNKDTFPYMKNSWKRLHERRHHMNLRFISYRNAKYKSARKYPQQI